MLKIKKLVVKGFKALNEFDISFNNITFIVGANASGKSTVLNSLIFLQYCCVSTVEAYLKDHKLTVEDICSTFSNKQQIQFEVTFEDGSNELSWSITFHSIKKTNSILLRAEKVVSGENVLLEYQSTEQSKNSYRLNAKTDAKEKILRGDYKQSFIGQIRDEDEDEFSDLLKIKKYFKATEPFDLLSPKDMRETSRSAVDSMGRNGEKLAAFLNNMPSEDRKALVEALKSVYPNIVEVKGVTKGRPGWAHVQIEEQYEDNKISVSSRNVSDGVLRLIAFLALQFHKSSGGVTLLDEVENGVNNELLEPLVKVLQAYVANRNQQLIVTTHSTVLLDFVNHEDIRYLVRDSQGGTKVMDLFNVEDIREKLAFMYPGEVLLSITHSDVECYAKRMAEK